jgi:multiple sugar transport system substrate-binding protein
MFANVESLLARRDIFEANAIQYPASLKDLLTVARRLHKPKRGQYGLAWNAARGMPIASAFMFFLNAHGGTVIDAEEKTAPGRSRSDRKPRVRATLDTPQAHATLAFMQRLLSVSPPDTLAFTWEDSLNEFMSGRAALCYAWSMRAARLELDLRSKVKGKVEFLPHPNIHGVRRSVPLGGFCLAVPSNLPPERAAVAQEAIRWLTSSDAVQSRGRNALPIATRFGVGSDPEMTAISHIVNFVDNLVRHGLVCNTMRPITPVYSRIEDLLGVEIHNALCGLISPEAALQKIQAKAQDLLDSIARPDEVPRRADNRAS